MNHQLYVYRHRVQYADRTVGNHVCTSLEEKPRRLPTELLSALRPYLRIVETSANSGLVV
jgi:hypothetical protein